MRIATWNVNGLRARLDFVLNWIRSCRPDIVGLQELKLTEDHFPYNKFKAEGYNAVVHSQKAWNGVAILSRESLELEQGGLPGQEDYGARLISGSTGGFIFTTVYCPNGKQVDHPDFDRKLRWFDSLRKYLKARHQATEPMILCGDFNVCPTHLDTWNEQKLQGNIFHTKEERTRFHSLLDWGLFDLYRELYPRENKFSWWDYRAGAFHRNMGLRIDLILATAPVMQRVDHVEINREYRKKKEGMTASDHAPVIVDLT